MVDRNKVRGAFEEMGLELSDEVADKCIELCERYNMNENEICDAWMVHAVNNKENSDPTVESLIMMERKSMPELTKRIDKSQRYNATPKYSNQFDQNDEETTYEMHYPETKQLAYPKTPESNRKGKGHHGNRVHSPGMSFSPFSISPAMRETGQGYLQRTNAGQVVSNYGESIDSLTWTTTVYDTPDVKFGFNFDPMNSGERYMYCTLLDKVQQTRTRSNLICNLISDQNAIERPHSEVHDIAMETTSFAGRIICDGNGKLNSSSVLLESNQRGDHVRLKLNDLPEYSLFPGQNIVLKGKNPDGMKIIVEKIYTDVKLPMYPPFENNHLKEPLQIVIACGPYMLSNGCYKPLEDLVEYVAKHKPNALILIGPILDTNHQDIIASKFVENFKEYTKEIIAPLFESIANCHTKVILVSSWKEACLNIVYPTPPTPVKIENDKLFLAPDPSIINISGFHIGVTSTDILMHLGKEELFCSTIGSGTQRLNRLASHLFQQKSFYPLNPPNEDMSVDSILLNKHGEIPEKPHLMVVPSDLKSFVNVISDSVFVNPEKLTKGTVGGTFARIQVRPAVNDEKWSPVTHVSAQIVKI